MKQFILMIFIGVCRLYFKQRKDYDLRNHPMKRNAGSGFREPQKPQHFAKLSAKGSQPIN